MGRVVQLRGDVVTHLIVGRRALEPQGSGERSPSLGEVETTRIGVHVCPSARQPVTMVGNQLGWDCTEIAPDRHDA